MNEFDEDCIHFWGKPLQGVFKHYCAEWDYLPIDETCPEFEYCLCYDKSNDHNDDLDSNVL